MKYVFNGIILAALALFTACGSNNSNSGLSVNGNWSASLTDSNNQQVFSFTTALTQNSNGSISGENLTFTTNSACFANGGTETGTITINGNTSGVTSAGIQLAIASSGTTPTNSLTLNGTYSNSTITGTWTLTGGTGCTGNGNFTMTKVS
jgi:hypothetical protein